MGINANATAAFYTSTTNNSLQAGLNVLTLGFNYIEPSGIFSLDTILNYTTACIANQEVCKLDPEIT